MATAEVRKALAVTAAVYDRKLMPEAIQLILSDLEGYPPEAILSALTRCRKELRTFPTVADIVARIDDTRPGPEEAWAMIPKSESETVVWTGEMRDAFDAVRSLMDDDMIAARMAFLETYRKLVSEARANGTNPRWQVSMGHDPNQRERAIRKAVTQGRLTQEYAAKLLPDQIEDSRELLPAPLTEEQKASLLEVRKFLQDFSKDREFP